MTSVNQKIRFTGICVTVGLCILFLVAFGVRQYEWNVSALLHMDTVFGETNAVPSGLILYQDGGYDGMLYYQVARDIPTLIAGDTPKLHSPYRYQRILLPLTAFLLSAGHDRALPFALLLINIVAAIGTLALMLFLTKGKALHALTAVLSPAMLVGILYSLTEPLSTFFIVVFFVIWQASGRRITPWSLLPLTLSLFARETTVFLITLLLLWSLWRKHWNDAGLLVLPLFIFVGWQWFLEARFGSVGFQANSNIIAFPLHGPLKMLQWLWQERGMHQLYRLSSVGPLLFLTALMMSLFTQWRQQKSRIGVLPFLLSGLCVTMLCMHPHMWGVITSIGRVVTPLYPVYALYAAERDSLFERRLSLFLIVLSVVAAIGIAAIRHPYVLS